MPPPDRSEQPGLDPTTAEWLLDPRTGGHLVPPAYAGVMEVLDALRGPAHGHELAGRAAALADFRARHRRRPARGRSGAMARVRTVKAAAAAVAVISVVGVAAATTDLLPGTPARSERPVGPTASPGPTASARSAAAKADLDRIARLGLCEAFERGSGDAERAPAAEALATLAGGADEVGAYCRRTGASAPADAAAGRGPDASGPAGTGLCRAYRGGRGAEQGGKESAAAFAALARAAGGADRIEEYCGSRSAGRPSPSGDEPEPSPPSATARRHGPAATPSHPGAPETPRGRGGGSGMPPAPPAPPSGDGPPTARAT